MESLEELEKHLKAGTIEGLSASTCKSLILHTKAAKVEFETTGGELEAAEKESETAVKKADELEAELAELALKCDELEQEKEELEKRTINPKHFSILDQMKIEALNAKWDKITLEGIESL